MLLLDTHIKSFILCKIYFCYQHLLLQLVLLKVGSWIRLIMLHQWHMNVYPWHHLDHLRTCQNLVGHQLGCSTFDFVHCGILWRMGGLELLWSWYALMAQAASFGSAGPLLLGTLRSWCKVWPSFRFRSLSILGRMPSFLVIQASLTTISHLGFQDTWKF